MRRETDDYWGESDVQKFALFSFENESGQSEKGGFFAGNTSNLSSTLNEVLGTGGSSAPLAETRKKVIPNIHELMSEKSLNCVLEADFEYDPALIKSSNISLEEEVQILRRQVKNRWTAPDEKNTIHRMLLGQPYSLELYKSLESKKALLNFAVSVGDGAAILAVLLFLMKTLKRSLFNQILMTNPVAADHYIYHLSTRMQINDLTDTLTMLGKNKDASIKLFEMACQNPQRQLKRLTSCLQNHFVGDKDRIHVERFIKLLEWQQTTGAPEAQSVVNLLEHSCKHHWSKPKNDPHSPFLLSQQYGVNEKLFQWTALTVLAEAKAWSDIDSIFMTKQWLGGTKLKTALPIEYVVRRLHKLEAPKDTLVSYIKLVDNVEQRLNIARSLRCDKAIIDAFVALRDRPRLLGHLANMDPQNEDYKYAESVLASSTTKWKN